MSDKKKIWEEQPELMGAVEAILFTMGESVEVTKIAAAIDKTEKETREISHCVQVSLTGT